MRRSRSKARKPRYVSLRRHLAPPPPPPLALPDPTDMSSSAAAPEDEGIGDRHQLDLFPLHSDHIDRDTPVACLLDDRGRGTNPTLAALLGGGASASSPSLDSQSMNWEDDGGGDADALARRALRGRERWAYWRASSSDEEVASTGAVAGGVDLWQGATETRFLALKLDYEEILAAWSDRGPLYTDGDGPQVVPDLHHQIYTPFHSSIFPVLMEVSQGGGASPWKVPEAEHDENASEELVKKEVISREARVNRYKEKRGNRLFAKRIRYEVRKMNAEKRPRIKGRFVKRKDGNEDHS